MQVNADGNVDIYIGPTAPTGHESNWCGWGLMPVP